MFLRYNIQMGTWMILKQPPLTTPGFIKCYAMTCTATTLYLLYSTCFLRTYEYIIANKWKELPPITGMVVCMAACAHSRNAMVYFVVSDTLKLVEKRRPVHL